MSGMLTKLTNMFVHDYKLPHHQSFPPPSTYMPLPATVSPDHLDCPRSSPGPVWVLFADPGPGPQVQVQSFSHLDLDTNTAVY